MVESTKPLPPGLTQLDLQSPGLHESSQGDYLSISRKQGTKLSKISLQSSLPNGLQHLSLMQLKSKSMALTGGNQHQRSRRKPRMMPEPSLLSDQLDIE